MVVPPPPSTPPDSHHPTPPHLLEWRARVVTVDTEERGGDRQGYGSVDRKGPKGGGGEGSRVALIGHKA